MYSEEQYRKALEVYEETKSVTKTITILGYPARRQTLYNWIHRKRILPEEKSTFRGYNTKEHPRHPPLEQKLQILHRCWIYRCAESACPVFWKSPVRKGEIIVPDR